jgi:hypothetical protein
VVGVLPGSKRADEAVLYMAHWDHLGKHEGDRRQHLQRRGRQRDRRGRHPRSGRSHGPPGAEAGALGGVPGGDPGRVRPAGFEVLRRPPDLPAGQDRRCDQHRCDVGGRPCQGRDRHRLRQLGAGGHPQAAGRRPGPHPAW